MGYVCTSYLFIDCHVLLLDAQRDIQGKASSDLADAGLDGLRLSFYLTSIYDHSIFEVSIDVCVCTLYVCVCL